MATAQWHSDYQASLKNRDMESLLYIIDDCQRAIEAMPENPKAGQYADEIHYCRAEIARRQAQPKSQLVREFARKHGLQVIEISNGVACIKIEEM